MGRLAWGGRGRGAGVFSHRAMGHGGYHLLLILCWVRVKVQLSGGLLAERSTKPPPTLTSTIVSEANPGGAVVLFGTTAATKSLGLFLSPLHAGRTRSTAPYARSLDLRAGWHGWHGCHCCHYWHYCCC